MTTFKKIGNRISTTIKAGSSINNSDDPVTFNVTDATDLPAVQFYITIEQLTDSSVHEIMLVTGIDGDELTATRAQDGTTKQTFSAGDLVQLRVIAAHIDDITTAVNSIETNYLKLDQTTPQTITNDSPIFNALNASQLMATDASKKLVSLATTTYPSLDELSYVKGVTSAIQTQFSGKQDTLTFGIADTNAVQIDDLDAAANDYCKLTASGIVGRDYAEVLGDLSGQAGADFSMNTHKITGLGDPTANQDAATKKSVEDITVIRRISLPVTSFQTIAGGCTFSERERYDDYTGHVITLDFDPTASERAQFNWGIPADWKEGTAITVYFVYYANATTGDIRWQFNTYHLKDGDSDPMGYTPSTVSATITVPITAYEIDVAQIGSFTPNNGDKIVSSEVLRVATHGVDTLTVDAQLLEVILEYTAEPNK